MRNQLTEILIPRTHSEKGAGATLQQTEDLRTIIHRQMSHLASDKSNPYSWYDAAVDSQQMREIDGERKPQTVSYRADQEADTIQSSSQSSGVNVIAS